MGNNKQLKILKSSVCKTCGKKFLYYPLSTKGIFCSFGCRRKYQKGKIGKNAKLIKKGEHLSVLTEFKEGNKNNFKNAMVASKCLACKKEILDFSSSHRNYCSYACYWKAKKELMKSTWSNSDYKDRAVKAILKGLIKRPTSLEKQMIDIIKRNNLPYKYTGDGSFLIGYKNPDFVNINGEKKLIEVGNTYHHQGNYSGRRRKHFAKYGWESHIFIGKHLNEDYILKILKNG